MSGPVSSVAAPATPASRIAVLVRTHVITAKLHDLLNRLGSGLGYDLFVCADETAGPVRLPQAKTIAHSEASCAALGLPARSPGHRLLWYCGDYALYCARAALPDYDYYVSFEYDIGLVRDTPLFLEGLLRRLEHGKYDLVATQFGTRAAEWQWSSGCAVAFPAVYGILFPLVALSARALDHLFAERRREASLLPANGQPVHCEAFVPSALMRHGEFRCADVNALLPGAWDIASFRIGAPMLLGALPPLPRTVEIVHPVFSEREYLRHTLDAARAAGTLQDLLTRLAPGGDLAVSPKLRGEFLKETVRCLSAPV